MNKTNQIYAPPELSWVSKLSTILKIISAIEKNKTEKNDREPVGCNFWMDSQEKTTNKMIDLWSKNLVSEDFREARVRALQISAHGMPQGSN